MYIYEQKDIREVLEQLAENDFTVADVEAVVIPFIELFEDKSAFKDVLSLCEKFEGVCKMANCNIKFTADGEIDDSEDAENVFGCLKKVFQTTIVDHDAKIAFVNEFLINFAECSDNEDYCQKVFIVIKNLDGDGFNIIKEYNSLDEADADIDDTYVGCCDDAYLAENLWYTLLCGLRSQEFDYFVNFCSVLEFDGKYFEEGREYWEEEYCEDDDED